MADLKLLNLTPEYNRIEVGIKTVEGMVLTLVFHSSSGYVDVGLRGNDWYVLADDSKSKEALSWILKELDGEMVEKFRALSGLPVTYHRQFLPNISTLTASEIRELVKGYEAVKKMSRKFITLGDQKFFAAPANNGNLSRRLFTCIMRQRKMHFYRIECDWEIITRLLRENRVPDLSRSEIDAKTFWDDINRQVGRKRETVEKTLRELHPEALKYIGVAVVSGGS